MDLFVIGLVKPACWLHQRLRDDGHAEVAAGGIRMALLDRDRTPALFAIATSVISSCISLAVGKFILTGMPRNVLLIWVAVVFLGVAVVSWVGLHAIRRARKRSQRAFLIVSAFDQKYYIASFVQRLNKALDRVNIDMVLKVPDRDYDASAQSHHLERVLDRRHGYMGGVIFAGEVHQLRDDLLMFCRKTRLPVVSPIWSPSRRPSIRTIVSTSDTTLGSLGNWPAGGW